MALRRLTSLAVIAILLILASGTANAAVSISDGLDLSGKTIVIDPGHKSDEVSRSMPPNGSGEYYINHEVATILEQLLIKDGANVYLTDRMGDEEEPGIGTRAKSAISQDPDLFISIHTNAAGPTSRGTEVWVWSANDKSGFRERELAELVYNSVIEKTQQKSTRGIREKQSPWDGKTDPWYHLGVPILSDYEYPCPAVLVELDFTTYESSVTFNGKEYKNMRQLMLSPEYQKSAAEALRSAIFDYFYYDDHFKKLDLIFLIDTTGSMWDDIESVKASANKIVEALDSKNCDYRVCVADYRDYPMYPYGQPGLDYVYKLDLAFSSDKDVIIKSINNLDLGNGEDWEESVYSALVKAISDPDKDLSNQDNYGWRKGVTKCIILMGDAPPHIPEEWEGGYSLDDVVYWSEHVDPVAVHSIRIGSDSSTYSEFSEISKRTGGSIYTADSAEDLVDTIVEVIEDIDTMPPESINNLTLEDKTSTWIKWAWTNPSDPDFNHTKIYLNGIFQTDTSAEYFNATGLEPDTSYTISTRTADIYWNVNETWINATVTTEKALMPTFPGCTNPPIDLDQDGLYEDINGNGELDFDDVVVYYDNMDWIEENVSIVFFDYNKNGLIDFDDAVKLYDML